MSRPLGYGERTPPPSSMPAVTTSSPTATVSPGVDLAHDQDAAELADHLAGRGVGRQLADDRRLAVGQQDDLGAVRPDLGHPAGERAAGGDDDVADLDPVVAALVEDDQPPELGRLAGDDRRRRRSCSRARRGAGGARSAPRSRGGSPRAGRSRRPAARSRRASAALSTRSRSISAIVDGHRGDAARRPRRGRPGSAGTRSRRRSAPRGRSGWTRTPSA